MKKLYWIFIIAGILIIGLFAVRFIILGNEDGWIKDGKGVYVKHGNPASMPDHISEQQNAVNCAVGLYAQEKQKGVEFNSQCLGSCGDYAVDIVHVPRTSEDSKIESQCSDYREGKASKFIELDKDGNIVRIV